VVLVAVFSVVVVVVVVDMLRVLMETSKTNNLEKKASASDAALEVKQNSGKKRTSELRL